MKKLIIGLLALSSLGAFADSKVICGNGRGVNSNSELSVAVERANDDLNHKLYFLEGVTSISQPTIVTDKTGYGLQQVSICVSLLIK